MCQSGPGRSIPTCVGLGTCASGPGTVHPCVRSCPGVVPVRWSIPTCVGLRVVLFRLSALGPSPRAWGSGAPSTRYSGGWPGHLGARGSGAHGIDSLLKRSIPTCVGSGHLLHRCQCWGRPSPRRGAPSPVRRPPSPAQSIPRAWGSGAHLFHRGDGPSPCVGLGAGDGLVDGPSPRAWGSAPTCGHPTGLAAHPHCAGPDTHGDVPRGQESIPTCVGLGQPPACSRVPVHPRAWGSGAGRGGGRRSIPTCVGLGPAAGRLAVVVHPHVRGARVGCSSGGCSVHPHVRGLGNQPRFSGGGDCIPTCVGSVSAPA